MAPRSPDQSANSPIWAASSSSTRSADCTTTTLARAAMRQRRLRRHAVHRHRRAEQSDCRSRSDRPPQSATHTLGREHGFLSEPDVERPFFGTIGQPIRQFARLHLSAARGHTRISTHDPVVKHLLIAQAHIPPTELIEVAGFTGTKGTLGPRFDHSTMALVGLSRCQTRRASAMTQSGRVVKRLTATPIPAAVRRAFPAVAAAHRSFHDVRAGDRRI